MKTITQILDFLQVHWLYIVPVVEALLRIIPTKKNISLIDNAWKLLNFIITNRRKPDGSELITSEQNEKVKNFVQARITKHVLKAILILCSFSSFGQNPIYTQSRAYLGYNASDTAAIQSTRTSLQTLTGNAGGLYFDKTRNKWRIWDGTQWTNLTGQGGTGAFWPLAGTGTLTDDVDIAFSSHNLNITGTSGTVTVGNVDDGIVISPGSVTLSSTAPNISMTPGLNTMDSYTLFTPTLSSPGVNVGTVSGVPASTLNGDLWYNTPTNAYQGKKQNVNINFLTATAALANNSLAIVNGPSSLSEDAGLNFTSQVLNAPNIRDAGLTISRITFAGTGGLLQDDSDLTFTGGNTLNATAGIFGNVTSSALTQFRIPIAGSGGILTDVSSLTFTGGARLNTNELSISQGQIISGTYTPTVTGLLNIDVVTAFVCNYIRVGNVVTVSGQVGIDATSAAATTRFSMTCPITTSFDTNQSRAGGTFSLTDVSGIGGAIKAILSTNTVQFSFAPVSTANLLEYFFSFTYLVQ